MWPPRLVVAAPQGRSGKTIVTLGLAAALAQKGLVVQTFKKGPDYIDPSWLTAASGRSCRNLDLFLMSPERLTVSFQQASQEVDLALIEGAMGLYDGFDLEGSGSTAQLARLLGAPVLLVVNTARMTRSVAAMVSGYQHFEPGVNIGGVILNNVARSRHERLLTAALERYCGLPVLGCLPREVGLSLTERHLGLVPYGEDKGLASVVESIARGVKAHVDLDGVLALARQAPARFVEVAETPQRKAAGVRLGVMRDRVFTFYYPENLEALRQAGAELVFLNSLEDRQLPNIDGLYIGGGFPEMFLEALEANASLRQDIARAVEEGLPVYAECAGLMYLCQGICWQGRRSEMVGALPGEVQMEARPQGHGYVEAEVVSANPFFPVGMKVRGHEFHHSRLVLKGEVQFGYSLRRGQGINSLADGIIYRKTFAAYTHLHALGVPQWAETFVSLAAGERARHQAGAGSGRR